MRIVLDMQGAQTESRFRGIGRYTISLTQAIIRNRGEHEIILALSGLLPEFIDHIRNTFDELLPQENIRVWYAPGPVKESEPGNKKRRAIAEKIREEFLISLKPDIVHIFSPFEGYGDESITELRKIIHTHVVTTTVYDLIPLIYQDSYLNHHPAYKAHYLAKLNFIKETAGIITISESSKNEIATYLGNYSGLLANCYLGSDSIFRKVPLSEEEISSIKRQFKINKFFILYTGGADERKNLYRFIEAYANLPEQLFALYQLVFSGKISESERIKLVSIARSKGLSTEQLIFTGYISDHELNSLFNICDLFVFPSWHEGFGLPALEAMKCGAAVIGSDKTSIPEVINNPGALFDPFSIESITSKMAEALLSNDFRETLKKQGLEQAERFSWDNSAKDVLAHFEKVVRTEGQKRSIHKNSGDSLERLINEISAEKSIKTEDLVGLAYCMNATFPEKERSKQVLIDITGLQEKNGEMAESLVDFFKKIHTESHPDLNICAVYSSDNTQQYFYSDSFFKQKTYSIDNPKFDIQERVEIWNGDIFLTTDFNPNALMNNSDILKHWQNQGAVIKTIICEAPVFEELESTSVDFSEHPQQWLQETEKYSGVICTSESLATKYLSYSSNQKSESRKTFSINWFPLETNKIEANQPSSKDDLTELNHELAEEHFFYHYQMTEKQINSY